MYDYSFLNFLNYLYCLDIDESNEEEIKFQKYIGDITHPTLYHFLSFLSWASTIIIPITFAIFGLQWYWYLIALVGINVISIFTSACIVINYRCFKYKFHNLDFLTEECKKLNSIKDEAYKLYVDGYNSYNNSSYKEYKRYYRYYCNMHKLCSAYKDEKKKKKLEAQKVKEVENQPVAQEDKVIKEYLRSFDKFIDYLKTNSEFLEEYDYDFKNIFIEISQNGYKILVFVMDNKDSSVLLNKTFNIYLDEVQGIFDNLRNIEELRTEENINKFINVLENLNTYFINLKDKVIEFKAVNLDISMNTILKELDIDNFTAREDEKGDKE